MIRNPFPDGVEFPLWTEQVKDSDAFGMSFLDGINESQCQSRDGRIDSELGSSRWSLGWDGGRKGKQQERKQQAELVHAAHERLIVTSSS